MRKAPYFGFTDAVSGKLQTHILLLRNSVKSYNILVKFHSPSIKWATLTAQMSKGWSLCRKLLVFSCKVRSWTYKIHDTQNLHNLRVSGKQNLSDGVHEFSAQVCIVRREQDYTFTKPVIFSVYLRPSQPFILEPSSNSRPICRCSN